MRSLNFWFALVFICVTYTLWKPLTLFYVPGILLLYSEVRKDGVVWTATFVVAASLSYWVISFWSLQYIVTSLTNLYYFTMLLTLAAMLILSCWLLVPMGMTMADGDISSAIILAGVFLLRFIPMSIVNTPSGADMSMHTYITTLITMANGIPTTYQPLLNIDSFDTFPIGFHTVSALISLLGHVETYRATFIVSCITYSLSTCAVFVLLRRYHYWYTSLFVALWFSFLTESLQAFVGWGGNPTAFALVFLIFFLGSYLTIDSCRSIYVLLAAAFLDAVLLSHTIVFIQGFYILGASIVVFHVAARRWNKSALLPALAVIVLFFIFAAPYILKLNYGVVTAPTIAWIKNWVRNQGHDWHGSIMNFYWSIPLYIFKHTKASRSLGIVTSIISAYGVYVLYKKSKPSFLMYLTFLIVCVLLILNVQYWVLPFSFAIYPERVAAMVIIPLGVFFLYGFSDMIARIQPFYIHKRVPWRYAAGAVLIPFLAASCYYCNYRKYISPITQFSSVTNDDLKGIDWLESHTSPSTLIANNYGDAGLWIPAIARRRVTSPHVNVMYLDKVGKGDSKRDFVFVGSKCVYSESCHNKAASFLANPSYRLVFRSNGTFIFQNNDDVASVRTKK